MTSSDAELIGRSLDGDGEPFVEVISRHEGAIGAYLARRVGRAAAEDLLGDVLGGRVRVAADLDRKYGEARPWLYGVALNTLRRYWRSRPAEELVPDVTGMARGSDPWSAVDTRVDTQAVLRSVLARLRPEGREVLTLVAWEDLTVADAARWASRPGPRRLLHQARTALRSAPEIAALLTDTTV